MDKPGKNSLNVQDFVHDGEIDVEGLIGTMNLSPASKSKPSGNIYCERCGGSCGPINYGPVKECDCRKRFALAWDAVLQVDLAGNMTFEALKNPDPSVAAGAQKLEAIVSGGRSHGVFMFGLPGRGKTHLSIATARALLEKDALVGVFNLASLVGRIQSTYGYSDEAESRTKIIQDVIGHDVVILDDIGKEHTSSNVESIVYELIDGIHRAGRILIASSNLPGKEFVERYDGAVLSRFGGMCEKLVIRGEDQRAAQWNW